MTEKPTFTVTVRDAAETEIIGDPAPPADTAKSAAGKAAKKEEEQQ